MADAPDDDKSIGDEVQLWRRIHPQQVVIDDNAGGVRRLSSSAFSDSSDGTGMSVTIGDDLLAAGHPPDFAVRQHPGFGIASITAKLAREKEQVIQRAPNPPDDPFHAMVWGKKTKSVQRAFAKSATWIIECGPQADSTT